jgi:16S rRNA (cytosine1402-N4)-methyltransferase
MMRAEPHIPVLCDQVIAAMNPQDGGVYVDGTFGAGGYTRALLQSAECRVIGIDRDPGVRPFAENISSEFGDRFSLVEGRFSDMVSLLKSMGIKKVSGIVLDIGVSSMQLDQPERGFSFAHDGPLDMRMGADGMSARDVVNEYGEKELADILFIYGEEKASRRIARAVLKAREEAPIETTGQLADLIRSVVRSSPKEKKDPATRSFQALRIFVNEELKELEQVLNAAEAMLCEGGRLVVVTFHSLEDRIVKRFLQEKSGRIGQSRHIPEQDAPRATFSLLYRKALVADEAESAANPRARSAKLRAAIRTAAPVEESM